MADAAQAGSGTRTEDGKWKKGVSGNPGGKPKGLNAATRRILSDIATRVAIAEAERAAEGRPLTDKERNALKSDGADALVRFWAGVMGDTAWKGTDRIAASKLLAAYGWGKPPEFAPIEEQDPLGWEEDALADVVGEFDARVVRLADRRRAGSGPS